MPPASLWLPGHVSRNLLMINIHIVVLVLTTHHHTEIDDAVVVAAEDDADDVLADVVDVAFHGGQHHSSRIPGLK